jgi:hypothetical protein
MIKKTSAHHDPSLIFSITDGAEQHREKHQVTATGRQDTPGGLVAKKMWHHSKGESSPKQPQMMVFVVFFFHG